jgi:hypothetical protein
MATRDISRSSYSRGQRYFDLHAQQGRLFTDADQIEQAELRAEDQRQTRLDTIGPYGSPDEGFRVVNPQITSGRIDFTLRAGTLYLGGQRLELLRDERFSLQSDWLNNPGASAPSGDESPRHLAVLLTQIQEVGAIEDSELLEPGLGGPDTSVRLRTVSRVVVFRDIRSARCEDAWLEVLQRPQLAEMGRLNEEMELVPDTRFTLKPLPGAGNTDLCAPPQSSGYLGAENQAIRLMLTGNNRFIWGNDNASALYRVEIGNDGRTLRLINPPRDALHWPATDQTVELLGWGGVLDNGEKFADEAGESHFARVETGYSPDNGRLILRAADAVLPSFGVAWKNRADAAALVRTRYGQAAPAAPYFFMRVWDRGPGQPPGPTFALQAGDTPLGNTGLAFSLSGNHRRRGDHIIISARPNTRDLVLPWELMTSAPPLGMRRFAAPLALIEWSGSSGTILHDCRRRFRPLTELRGCCTYTVGDNNESFGDFSVIQDAIDALPAEGGRVCILPGAFAQRFNLSGRHGVRVEGCRGRSRILAPDDRPEPLVTLEGGGGFEIADLALNALHGPAIVARSLLTRRGEAPIDGLTLRGLAITARDDASLLLEGVDRLVIRDCGIDILPLERDLAPGSTAGRAPAVFARGEHLRILANSIRAAGDRAAQRAAGGLQIGGGSTDVLIADNEIEGGNGNGIELGHIVMVQPENADSERYSEIAAARPAFTGRRIVVDENGCIHYQPPGSSDEEPDPADPVPVSGGDLEDVVIRDNAIAGMGLSGIASPTVMNARRKLPVIITARGLTIESNAILGCALLETPEVSGRARLFLAFGGIALVGVCVGQIFDNRIEANGRRHIDAICGISVLTAESLEITDNRIVDNGPRTQEEGTPRQGLRAGIRVFMVEPHQSAHSTSARLARAARRSVTLAGFRALALPSLTVKGNVVHQPLGKALQVAGEGPMQIVGNHLASQGTPTGSLQQVLAEIFGGGQTVATSVVDMIAIAAERLLGSCVLLFNLGKSSELVEGLTLIELLSGQHAKPSVAGGSGDAARDPATLWRRRMEKLNGGEILFNDNTVVQNYLDRMPSLSLAGTMIFSLDDVSIQSNSFSTQMDFTSDFCLSSVIGMGWSVRLIGNRMEETMLMTLNSAITAGFYNNSSQNQATHCLEIIGLPALTVRAPNSVLLQAINPLACGGCLVPPFEGLTKEARDANGQSVTPDFQTIAGVPGLRFGDWLRMTLGANVAEADLGFRRQEGTTVIEVRGIANGQTVLRQQLSVTQGVEARMRLAGARFDTIEVSGARNVVLLTRLCTGRPDIAPPRPQPPAPGLIAGDPVAVATVTRRIP